MRSRKNTAILFLSLTTVAGTIVAWQQHQELGRLREAATKVEAPPVTADASSMTADAEHLAEESAIAPQAEFDAPPAPGLTPNAAARDQRPNRSRADFRAMMDRPEIQRLIAIGQKSALDSRYSALFKSLSLTPDQLETFKELLVEKRTAVQDIRSAAREEGISSRNDPETLRKLVADAQTEIDDAIRATVGEAAFAKYENYEKTLPQRNVVNQLEQRLSYSSTPLSTQQSEQMVAIIAATNQASGRTNVTNVPLAGGGPRSLRGSETRITDATINQALGVLAAPQIDALRQLQQEQEAQAALSAAMRNRSRPPGSSPSPINSPAANTPPPSAANRGPSGG